MKFLADGGLSGATAALSVPYRHADTRGVLRFERDELLALCRESHDAGWRIATHAIGDVAIDQVLDIYEALGPHPRGCAIASSTSACRAPRQLARAAGSASSRCRRRSSSTASAATSATTCPTRSCRAAIPIRAMLDAGIPVALSSDAPVVENDNPLAGMQAAITRRDREGHLIAPDQAITVARGARRLHAGRRRRDRDARRRLGAIAPGTWADLAVLSGNPLTTPPEALSALTVDETWLAGELVYERT